MAAVDPVPNATGLRHKMGRAETSLADLLELAAAAIQVRGIAHYLEPATDITTIEMIFDNTGASMAPMLVFGEHLWLACVAFNGGCFDDFCGVSFGELELEVGLEQCDDALAGLAARLVERDFEEERHCVVAMWGCIGQTSLSSIFY